MTLLQPPATDLHNSRYSRQVLFLPIGLAGQAHLRTARVAVVGMGALGTVIATQLVRAGVGFVRLIDRDIIESSNLQRQSLYDEIDAADGVPKAVAAAAKLRLANHDVEVEEVVADLTVKNAEDLLSDVQLIFDGTDNFQVRYLINDVAVKHGIAWVYGGSVSSYGTTTLLRPGVTPCLVCLFGEDSPGGHDTCDTVGVIAPVVSIVASFQVAEGLKYLTKNLGALSDALTYIDVWTNEFRQVKLPVRDSHCTCCVERSFRYLLQTSDSLAISYCGRQTIQVKANVLDAPEFVEIAKRLQSLLDVRYNSHLLRFEADGCVVTLFRDGRALIQGTDDVTVARSLYARYIGM